MTPYATAGENRKRSAKSKEAALFAIFLNTFFFFLKNIDFFLKRLVTTLVQKISIAIFFFHFEPI